MERLIIDTLSVGLKLINAIVLIGVDTHRRNDMQQMTGF
jgi:hypothetical protein